MVISHCFIVVDVLFAVIELSLQHGFVSRFSRFRFYFLILLILLYLFVCYYCLHLVIFVAFFVISVIIKYFMVYNNDSNNTVHHAIKSHFGNGA